MKELRFLIKDKIGLHARPAGAISKVAKEFKSNITVGLLEKTADAKRLLSLMSLGAVHGSELVFKIEGEDENEAYIKIKEVLEEKLG